VAAEDVYKAWANALNTASGIQRHPVQLVTMKDSGPPGTAITDINSIISQHVVAMADMSDAEPGMGVDRPAGPGTGCGHGNHRRFFL
jgi:hypothetical protein